jgi:hypothetical protein
VAQLIFGKNKNKKRESFYQCFHQKEQGEENEISG